MKVTGLMAGNKIALVEHAPNKSGKKEALTVRPSLKRSISIRNIYIYRIFLTLLLQLVVSINSQAGTEVEVFEPIEKLFAAISNVKHQEMRATVTDSFVLLEDGEVWTIEDLISVVSPSEYTRTNSFSIINIETMNDIALVNYWNKANFDNKKSSEDVIWLESAVMKKVNGIWLLMQMHSTRLQPSVVPENVVFAPQKM